MNKQERMALETVRDMITVLLDREPEQETLSETVLRKNNAALTENNAALTERAKVVL